MTTAWYDSMQAEAKPKTKWRHCSSRPSRRQWRPTTDPATATSSTTPNYDGEVDEFADELELEMQRLEVGGGRGTR